MAHASLICVNLPEDCITGPAMARQAPACVACRTNPTSTPPCSKSPKIPAQPTAGTHGSRPAAKKSSGFIATAALILAMFDDFYSLLCEYPYRAKRAFEMRDPHASMRISKERLGLYSQYIAEHGPRMLAAFPALAHDSSLWESIDRLFVAMIVDRYEADTAFSFAHSLRRNMCHEIWRPVAYSFPPPSKLRAFSMASVHRRVHWARASTPALIASFLTVPEFSVPWRDLHSDAQRIVERLQSAAVRAQEISPPVALDVVEAGFFRDRSAFVVGRWVRARRQHRAVRGGAAERSARHLRRSGSAPGRRHPRPVQLGACQPARDDAALLSNLRISLQSDAAPPARASLLDDRLQPCRQGRHPERDRRADARQRTAVQALAGRAGNRRGRLHVRCLRLPSEGDPRPADPLVQMGAITPVLPR